MDTRRRDFNQNDTKSPSPEMFSFPGTPSEVDGDNSEFEFGSCVTPSSPVTPVDLGQDSASPADQFFLNGRLLPHEFPTVPSSSRTSFSGRENLTSTVNVASKASNIITSAAVIHLSRGTSVGSNMSIMSSRSNSSNSSTCSACNNNARASTGDVTERKTFHQKGRMMHMKGYCRTTSVREQRSNISSSSRLGKYYGTTASSSGSSKRWQFITPAPVLGPSLSRRSVGSTTSPRKSGSGGGGSNSSSNNNGGFLHRILRSIVTTCKACHAMEGQENDFDLDEGSVVVGS